MPTEPKCCHVPSSFTLDRVCKGVKVRDGLAKTVLELREMLGRWELGSEIRICSLDWGTVGKNGSNTCKGNDEKLLNI